MTIRASDIMSRDVITATPDETVHQIAKRLVDHGISAIPVCDPSGHPIGILSEGDLLRPLRQSVLEKRERWLELLAEGDRLSDEFIGYLKGNDRRVRDLMTAKVVTATEDASLGEIAELMVSNKIKRIPVVRGDILVGIVSRADIIRALARDGAIEA